MKHRVLAVMAAFLLLGFPDTAKADDEEYNAFWSEYYACIDDIEPTPKETLITSFVCTGIGIVATPIAGIECAVYTYILQY